MYDLHFMDPFQPVPEDQQIPRAIAHTQDDIEEGSTLNVRIIYKCNEAAQPVLGSLDPINTIRVLDTQASLGSQLALLFASFGVPAEAIQDDYMLKAVMFQASGTFQSLPVQAQDPVAEILKISNTILLFRRGG